jgi:hypothetical protein
MNYRFLFIKYTCTCYLKFNLQPGMLYFIGYNIDEALPRHSRLSRTRQMYGEEIFRIILKKYKAFTLIWEWYQVNDKR